MRRNCDDPPAGGSNFTFNLDQVALPLLGASTPWVLNGHPLQGAGSMQQLIGQFDLHSMSNVKE